MVARLISWGFTGLLITTIGATLGGVAALLRPNFPPLPLESYFYPKNELTPGFKHYQLSRPVTILLMGIDPVIPASAPEELQAADRFSGRSDTLILVRFDPTNSAINLLWIPRDTPVHIPKYGKEKINQANAIGGAALAARVVSLNFNYIPIDRYVRVRTTALTELVDLLGGVEILVPAPMSYTDITGQLTINLSPGWQTINGNQAIQFARFRNDELGDISRIQRQQSLLAALRQRISNPALITALPEIISVCKQHIDTNLTTEEMFTLVNFMVRGNPPQLKMLLLPGKFSDSPSDDISDWLVDPGIKQQIIQENLEEKPRNILGNNPVPKTIKIAIQNATNRPKYSEILAEYLKAQGLKNVYQIEPWAIAQNQTQIIAQKGNIQEAEWLKNLLTLGKVEPSSIGDINSDITIRVGLDVNQKFFKKREK
jgi:polyisoprenyl-teichoic acid--peptidoglycan teichoic acid transferase